MDDGGNIELVREMRAHGLWNISWNWFVTDIYMDGRLRLLNPFMMALLYMPAGSHSEALFFFNDSFVFLILIACAFSFYLSVKTMFPNISRREFFAFFLITSFAYPWTHYFFFCPSITEKLVLLFAAMLLATLHFLRDMKSHWKWLACFVPLFSLALNTKEEIVFFFPLFLAFQLHLDRAKGKYGRFCILFALFVLGTWILHWVGGHGDYKAKYGLAGVVANLHKSKSVYIFTLLALVAEFCNFLQWRRTKDFFLFLQASAYPAGLLIFVLIMLPWGLGFYLNSVAVVFFVLCCLLILKTLESLMAGSDFVFIATLALMPLAILVTMLKTGIYYSALGDYGKLLASPELRAIAEEKRIIYMPCDEGSIRTAQYARLFQNMKLETNSLVPKTADEIRQKGGPWIFSPAMCSNGMESVLLDEAHGAKVLFRGRWSSGTYLVDLH